MLHVGKYSNRCKKLSWFKRWSTGVRTDRAQRWLDDWLGRRKAPESETPQVREVSQKSGAGSEEDPHQQQYSNEDFYEAGEGDADESGENTSEGRKKQKKSSEAQTSQCRCQGPNGQHRCKAEATWDGRCDLCLLGCATFSCKSFLLKRLIQAH